MGRGLVVKKFEVAEIEAEEDGVVGCEGVGLVERAVARLIVVERVAEVNRAIAGDDTTEGERGERADADHALIDVVIGCGAGVGAVLVPDVEDAVVLPGDFHFVFLDLGVVEIESEVGFEFEVRAERETSGEGEVYKDTVFNAEDAALDIASAVGEDALAVVGADVEGSRGLDACVVESEDPAPSTGIVVADTEAYLISETVGHGAVFLDGEGIVVGDGVGDKALGIEVLPDFVAVRIAVEDAVDGVGVVFTTAVKFGLLVVRDEESGINRNGKTIQAESGRSVGLLLAVALSVGRRSQQSQREQEKEQPFQNNIIWNKLYMVDFGFHKLSQQSVGAIDANLDGVEGQLGLGGYLLVGETLKIAHLNDLSILGRHLTDDIAEGGDALVEHHLLLGCAFGVGEVGRDELLAIVVIVVRGEHIGEREFGAAAATAAEIKEDVGSDGEDPAAERACWGVVVELAEGLAEGLHGEVVGVEGVARHAQKHVIYRVAVETHKVGVGLLIPVIAGSAYEEVVALGAWGCESRRHKLSSFLFR